MGVLWLLGYLVMMVVLTWALHYGMAGLAWVVGLFSKEERGWGAWPGRGIGSGLGGVNRGPREPARPDGVLDAEGRAESGGCGGGWGGGNDWGGGGGMSGPGGG